MEALRVHVAEKCEEVGLDGIRSERQKCSELAASCRAAKISVSAATTRIRHFEVCARAGRGR